MKRHLLKSILLTGMLTLSANSFAMNFDDLNSVFTDTMITTNIKSKIMIDKTLSNQNITITTNNAIVSVIGNADSTSSASLLIQTIASSYGVKNIDASKLHLINDNKSLSDVIITAEIRGMFMRYQIFGDVTPTEMPIAISTQNGNVIFYERTPLTEKQLADATKVAQVIQGVKSIDVVNPQNNANIE